MQVSAQSFSGVPFDRFVDVKQYRPNVPLIAALCGNKAEYRDDHSPDSRCEVSLDEARHMAQTLNLPYFETSAANNLGVEDTFKFFAEEFYKRYA